MSDELNDTHRKALERAKEAQDGVSSLLGPALRVMADTLAEGQGDATAVRLAKWIAEFSMDHAKALPQADHPPGFERNAAEAELASVLRLVKK